jgi:hypothetical protein
MQVHRKQSEPTAKEILERIQIAVAEQQRRRVTAEADEARNRVANQNERERAEVETARAVALTAGHENWRRWIATMASVAVLMGSVVLGSSTSSVTLNAATWTTTSPADIHLHVVAGAAKELQADQEHLSSSAVQRKVELALLKRLGKDEGVAFEKAKVPYGNAWMEVDGVDAARTIFIEAFARVGVLKDGQKKKVAKDALKFVALKAENPGARFVLAFADQAAHDSVVGWVGAVLDEHGIERVVVPISKALKKELLEAQTDQKAGMETGTG